MRSLVTGAEGFVGGHLLRALSEAGEGPIVAGSLSGRGAAVAGVEWAQLDVTSSDSIRAAVAASRPERVYHLAGQSSVGGSFRDPVGTWEVNAMGTLRLLQVLAEEGLRSTRVLVVSSAEVYGPVPGERQPIAESAPLQPVSPYGASKAAAELAGLQMASAGAVEVVVSRSFNHTGPGQDARFVLPSMARQLARMAAAGVEPVLHVGNLDVRRDFLDVRDVVRAYRCLMERGESGSVYNVCSGVARSLRDLVETLVRLSGTGARVSVDPDRFRVVDVPLLVGDAAKLRALGWEPEVEMEEMLRDLLADSGVAA